MKLIRQNFKRNFSKSTLLCLASLSLFICLIHPKSADAESIHVTISENVNAQIQAWWPNQFDLTKPWVAAFKDVGIDILAPYSLSPAPRMSPTVYAQYPLTESTAKTMASLFGADILVNGHIDIKCHDLSNHRISCEAQANAAIYAPKHDPFFLNKTYQAMASTQHDAEMQIRRRLAFDLSPTLQTRISAIRISLPQIVPNPVLRFSTMPDGDTLVAVRKCLKQVPGIDDVAERFVANGMIALEINPEHAPTGDDFVQIVQRFLDQGCDGYILKEASRSTSGSTIDITPND